LMLRRVADTFVYNSANIFLVRENIVDVATGVMGSTKSLTSLGSVDLGANSDRNVA
jgi:hypothetical protein